MGNLNNSKITPKQRKQIYKAWMNGSHHKALTKKYGVSSSAIGYQCRKYARENGFKIDSLQNRKIIPKEKMEEVYAKWESGITQLELGREYNCSQSGISRFLKSIKYDMAKNRHRN